MIFSEWQPEGGFTYYESSRSHPIGDDLPERSMPRPINGIGVPAQDVGFPLPRDARAVGEGRQPRGIMTPMARRRGRALGQLKEKLSQDDIVVVLALISILGAAAIAGRR